MTCRICAFHLLLFLVNCTPYPPETPETDATQTILESDLLEHLSAIAEQGTRGRATASPGYDRAAVYLIRELEKAGVEPGWTLDSGENVWKQPVPLDRFDYSAQTVLRFERRGEVKEFCHGEGVIILNPGVEEISCSGVPVFVGYGVESLESDWNDYSGLNLEGRLAIIMSDAPDPDRAGRNQNTAREAAFEGPFERFERLGRKGPSAIVMIPNQRELWIWESIADRNSRMPLFPVERYTQEQLPPYPFPLILLGENAVRWLFAETDADPLSNEGTLRPQVLDRVKAELVLEGRKSRTECSNLIGTIPGSDVTVSNEVVVVSAHLDHMGQNGEQIFPGANDDGSGCAAILELMEAVANRPFRRTVMAVFTTGEEVGHFGSLHFVRHPPVDQSLIVAALTLEHLGRLEDLDDGIEIVASNETIRRLKGTKPWLGASPVVWGDIEMDRSGKVRGSDTQSFRIAGIPVILLGGGGFPEYHTPEDTVDRIDLPHLRFATRVAYSIIEELANGPK